MVCELTGSETVLTGVAEDRSAVVRRPCADRRARPRAWRTAPDQAGTAAAWIGDDAATWPCAWSRPSRESGITIIRW